jgi:hypothetical protein
MRALVLATLVLSVPALAVTGSGVKLTESRKIVDFSEIEVSDGVTLEVTRGATALTISGDDNVVPLITTKVVGGRLQIHRTTSDWLRTKQPLVVKVSTPALKRFEASGGVEATLTSVADRAFAATLSGGVHLNATGLDVDTFELEASGGVTVKADGKAKTGKLVVSGGVEVKAKQLQIATVTLDASGGCELELTVKDSISGDLSGGVGVKVSGNPPKKLVRSSGGAGVDYVD